MGGQYQTLHSHTTASDGKLTHFEVLDACKNNNISVVAFTDHDGLIPAKEYGVLTSSRHDTKWVSGIEITSGLPRELGGGVHSGFHIVGLFVDPFDKKLLLHCQKAQDARVVRMQKMVKNLQSIGFEITEEECLKESGGEAVGRPHIANAIYSKDKNLRLIQNLIEKMRKDSESDERVRNIYHKMLSQDEWQRIFHIVLAGEESYLPGIYVDYQYWTDMDTSVSLIRDAGGIAILAHYFTVRKQLEIDLLEKLLEDGRLDGAETVYGLHALGTPAELELQKERELIAGLLEKYKRIPSGGADAHELESFEKFGHSGEYGKATVGMAERMIDLFSVNKNWSSL